MKKLVFLSFLFITLDAFAQEEPTYPALLNTAEEVMITDSLLISATMESSNLMDTMAMKKWFPTLLPATANNRLKNRNYYLAGKMTANNNFDLLLVLEEKKKNETTGAQVVYLVTRKKDGTFISSLEVAVAGTKKNSSYNTTSCLYKDNKIVLSSRMVINNKNYDDILTYKINKGGRFILAPKY